MMAAQELKADLLVSLNTSNREAFEAMVSMTPESIEAIDPAAPPRLENCVAVSTRHDLADTAILFEATD